MTVKTDTYFAEKDRLRDYSTVYVESDNKQKEGE
jgi:hypothetical protein